MFNYDEILLPKNVKKKKKNYINKNIVQNVHWTYYNADNIPIKSF